MCGNPQCDMFCFVLCKKRFNHHAWPLLQCQQSRRWPTGILNVTVRDWHRADQKEPAMSETSPTPPAVDSDDDVVMTTRELMEFLSLSRTKIWELTKKEGLPATKVGGDYRYVRSEVLAWLEKFRVDRS